MLDEAICDLGRLGVEAGVEAVNECGRLSACTWVSACIWVVSGLFVGAINECG